MRKILVVEDDQGLRRAIGINLRANGYEVLEAGTAAEAIRASAEQPDLIILDLGLPDADGSEVISGVRGWSAMPIIVLSARHTSQDKIAALDSGADDYMTKPFGMDELLARVRVAVRRGTASVVERVVQTPDFTVDLAAKAVIRDGREVQLTPTEWAILELLVSRRGQLVTQREILLDVWGPTYEKETNYLRVYFAHLRRKLEPEPSAPRYFRTVPGRGYRFAG